MSSVSRVLFAVEPFAAAFGEARPLLEKHWEEIAKHKDLLRIDPNEAFYENAVAGRKLLLITARSAGDLVGYFLWLLVWHPHYKHILVAEEDLHYLMPEHRRGLTGYLFVKEACQVARDYGAKLLVMREKVGHEHPALMKRLGFNPSDIVYTRSFGDS